MINWLRNKCRLKENISIDEINEMMKNNENIVLLDVRSPQEFAEGHLNNAINLPTYDIYQKVQEIVNNKETIIICYCTLGVRSKKAIKILKRLGYNNLYNLEGGIN